MLRLLLLTSLLSFFSGKNLRAQVVGCKPLPVYAVLAPAQVCGNQPFILQADDLFPHPTVRYVWHFPNGDSAVSAKTFIHVTPTSTAFSGEYFVLRDSAGCRSKPVGGAPVLVKSLAPGDLRAGNDTLICTAGVVVLRAVASPTGTAVWASVGTAKVDNPALALTSARNLVPGPNRFVWKADLPGCPDAAADTVTYFLEVAPLASDDRYTLKQASEDWLPLPVLLNDQLIGLADTVVHQLSSPAAGQLAYSAQRHEFLYTVGEDYRGTVTFRYAVCPQSISACGFGCDSATVTIEVLNLPKVPSGLLLGDPGDNGRLLIKGLGPDLRLEISIFNRWGSLVFFTPKYDNAAPWMGDFNGKNLPPGAYYYHLRLHDSAGTPIGGPLTGVVHLLERR